MSDRPGQYCEHNVSLDESCEWCEIMRLRESNAELLAALKWAYRALSEPPPIGKSHAELLTMFRAAIARAEAGNVMER